MKYKDIKTEYIGVNNKFAYRQLGVENKGIPLVLLPHLAATMDNWQPTLMDELAKEYHVIVFDNLGVGGTDGKVQDTIRGMAEGVVEFLQLLNIEKINLLGMSMGGFVAQELLMLRPNIVDKLILAGTGPRGGVGISKVGFITYVDIFRGKLHSIDPKRYLFFENTEVGKEAAIKFLDSLKRDSNKDKDITADAFAKQLKAIKKWGKELPADLSKVEQPTLVINGDNDRMVPTENTYDLAKRIPNSKLIIYKKSGHGAIFEYPSETAKAVIDFIG